jgi:hypothetical protein
VLLVAVSSQLTGVALTQSRAEQGGDTHLLVLGAQRLQKGDSLAQLVGPHKRAPPRGAGEIPHTLVRAVMLAAVGGVELDAQPGAVGAGHWAGEEYQRCVPVRLHQDPVAHLHRLCHDARQRGSVWPARAVSVVGW